MWEIRQATTNDGAIIAEGNRRLAWESEHKTLTPDVVRAGVAAALADPAGRGPYYLAIENGSVIGQCQVTFEWSDWRNCWIWWLQNVYVRPEARGRGVFRALAEHVQRLAMDAGNVWAVRLYVAKENAAARQVYSRLGFRMEEYDMMNWEMARAGS